MRSDRSMASLDSYQPPSNTLMRSQPISQMSSIGF